MMMLSEYSCSHVSMEEMALKISLFSRLSLLPSDGNDDGRSIDPANNLKRLPMHVDCQKIPKNSHRPKYMIIDEIQQSSA